MSDCKYNNTITSEHTNLLHNNVLQGNGRMTRKIYKFATLDTFSHASEDVCQIWKESIENYRRFRAICPNISAVFLLNDIENIVQGQKSLQTTRTLLIVIICTKHGRNPSRVVGATERTPLAQILYKMRCGHLVLLRAYYRQVSNIRRTLVGNTIVDHSDVVGASPVGASALLQLHLHFPLNIWFRYIAQWQLHAETSKSWDLMRLILEISR